MPINPYLNATFTKTAMKNHTCFIPVVIHIVGFEDKTAYHIDTYAHVSCDHIVTLVNEILRFETIFATTVFWSGSTWIKKMSSGKLIDLFSGKSIRSIPIKIYIYHGNQKFSLGIATPIFHIPADIRDA